MNERLAMRCLRLPAVVGCFVSTFILLSQLLLFASQYYRCYFLCLFLLFFFLSHAVCCPSCLRRLSSTAVTCFASTLPPLLLSRTRSRAVCASHFFHCCCLAFQLVLFFFSRSELPCCLPSRLLVLYLFLSYCNLSAPVLSVMLCLVSSSNSLYCQLRAS